MMRGHGFPFRAFIETVRQKFVQDWLTPGVTAAGIGGQPKVEFAETLSIFAPNV